MSEDAKPILYARLHSERGDIFVSIVVFAKRAVHE